MSSFGATTFKVGVDDKWYPGVTVDSDGVPHYQATIYLDSRAKAQAMFDKVAIVTAKRALGTRQIVFHVDVGDDYVLTVPGHAGLLATFAAVLVKCDLAGRADGGWYRAEVEFLISGDPTP